MTTTAMEKTKTEDTAGSEPTRTGPVFRPNVDIMETSDELRVLADVPGVARDGISVDFENGTLSIYGQVRNRAKENSDWMLQEFGVGDFYRSFQVNEMIDPAKITAEYANGVLTLHLPKLEKAKPRRITVEAR